MSDVSGNTRVLNSFIAVVEDQEGATLTAMRPDAARTCRSRPHGRPGAPGDQRVDQRSPRPQHRHSRLVGPDQDRHLRGVRAQSAEEAGPRGSCSHRTPRGPPRPRRGDRPTHRLGRSAAPLGVVSRAGDVVVGPLPPRGQRRRRSRHNQLKERINFTGPSSAAYTAAFAESSPKAGNPRLHLRPFEEGNTWKNSQ